jgi:hypothetical protein
MHQDRQSGTKGKKEKEEQGRPKRGKTNGRHWVPDSPQYKRPDLEGKNAQIE